MSPKLICSSCGCLKVGNKRMSSETVFSYSSYIFLVARMSANLQNWVPSSNSGLDSSLATLPIKVLLPQNLSADLGLSFPSFLPFFHSLFLSLSLLHFPSLPSFPAIMKKCRNQTKIHYSLKLLGNNLKDLLLQYFLMWNFFSLETHPLVIILT